MNVRSHIRRGKSAGFTLIEVIMGIVLLGIISVTVTMLLFQGAKSFETLDVRKELTASGTLSVERMSRELRLIRCTTAGNSCSPQAVDITAMTPTEVRFVNTLTEGMGFRIDAGALKMRRGSGAGDAEDILADNVSAFSIEYLKKDGTPALVVADVWVMNFTITLSKGAETVYMRSGAHPRSFR